MFVISAFHPSCVYKSTYTVQTCQKEYGIPGSLCSASLFSVKTWMEGTHDMPYKYPYFFVTTGPNRMIFFRFSTEMPITSYSFIILKHISD